MDLRQLNALVAVADHGTFSGAADALATVQSNVSTHVARLERELGAVLVDRSLGCLTAEGEAVVARARRVTAELEAVVADLSALRHEVAGTVRVGLIGTTARWLLPQLLELTAARHPRLHLVAVEATSTSLEPQLASGRLDLAVLNLPTPTPRAGGVVGQPQRPPAGRELAFIPLFDEDLVLVVAAGDPLAQRGELEMAELAHLDLLLPMAGTAFRDELDAALRPAGITLSPRAELDGTRLIASLTFEGLGPAILPATAVPGYLRQDWRLVGVRGIPRRRVGVAQRSRGLPSPPARALLALLHELTSGAMALPEGLHPIPEGGTADHRPEPRASPGRS